MKSTSQELLTKQSNFEAPWHLTLIKTSSKFWTVICLCASKDHLTIDSSPRCWAREGFCSWFSTNNGTKQNYKEEVKRTEIPHRLALCPLSLLMNAGDAKLRSTRIHVPLVCILAKMEIILTHRLLLSGNFPCMRQSRQTNRVHEDMSFNYKKLHKESSSIIKKLNTTHNPKCIFNHTNSQFYTYMAIRVPSIPSFLSPSSLHMTDSVLFHLKVQPKNSAKFLRLCHLPTQRDV